MLALAAALLLIQDPSPAEGGTPSAEAADPALRWPSWRGPLGTGEAPDADPPLRWSEEQNVRWKTPLPGLGHSTPVVWDGRLFLTWAVPFGPTVEPAPETDPGAHDNPPVVQQHRFEVAAFDLATGKNLWRRAVGEELPHERTHSTGSFASASPVTDGEHLFAYFGSRGLYCLDLDGYVLWTKRFGQMRTKHHHGEGSSPALHGDALVINWDHEEQSFVVCLDKATGEERWRTERDELTSWATPLITKVDGKAQVIVSGTERIRGYDLATGKVVWDCPGMAHNVVATPVVGKGILVAGSSYEKQAMIGLRLEGAQGPQIGTQNLLWYRRRGAPYVPSPLLLGDWLYAVNHLQGFLVRIELATGKEPQRATRLSELDLIFASPVGAAGRIYIPDRSGTTAVVEDAPGNRVLAWNQLDDSFSASPVAVGRDLILRGEQFLYCLAEQGE